MSELNTSKADWYPCETCGKQIQGATHCVDCQEDIDTGASSATCKDCKAFFHTAIGDGQCPKCEGELVYDTSKAEQKLTEALSSEMCNKLHEDGTFHVTPELMQIFAENVVTLAKTRQELDAFKHDAEEGVRALREIGDRRMWEMTGSGLTWRGETQDGNEINTREPLEIVRESLANMRSTYPPKL